MDVEIRDSTADDIPAIARLTYQSASTYRDFAGDDWRALDPFGDEQQLREDFERVPNLWSLVAECDGEVVAHVAITQARAREQPREPIPGLAHLWRLFVHPDHWGTGLARRLLRRAHAEMSGRGYSAGRLFTPKGQARARAFYEREGWFPTGGEEFSEDLQLELVEYRREL